MTIPDYLTALGVLLLAVGLALISIALALIVLGVLLLAAGLWSHHSHVLSGSPVPARNADDAATGPRGDRD